ncbi:MAG: sensor histidine kinase [Gemmatirosa sp.]
MRVSLLHSSARPLAGIAAAVVGAAALLRAARRRRTEATDPSHALLRGLFETSPDPSFVKDPAGRYLLCNAAAAQAMGHPVAAILGRTDAELLPAAQAAAVRAVDARVLATGEAITVEETVGEGDARRIYLSTKGVYRDADGGVVGVFGIARDITQRKADELALADANRVLEEARGRAEAASRAKSDFLATMSHELRTPLNAILGYADLLAMGLPGAVSDGQGRYFTRIEASGRHLLALIDDVLDVSKIEAGELTVDRRPSELVDVVEAALTLVRPQADAKGVALAAPAPEACAALRYVGDPDRVRQVLVNLLSNAVKFTPEGGRVDVTCGVEGDGAAPQIAVAVRDTGIGIPAEQHARIFEPFVQVNGGLSRRVGGTGLGLAISRQLVHLMGGEITVESAPGAGSTFTLWLPASSAAWEARVRLGERLLARMSDVLTAYVDALRHDPALPGAAQATRSALEGHAGALLAAMAHDFAVLDDGAADRGSLIADGGAFKALLAERHGGQRGRLGWDAALLGRDFAHLGDAIEHVLLGVPPRNRDAAALGDQLALLRAFLAEAESLAVEGLQRGVHTGTHAVPHAVPPAPAAPVV